MGAIHIDVIARLDERAARVAAERVEQRFGRAGRDAGDAFSDAVDQRMRLLQADVADAGGRSGRGFEREFDRHADAVGRGVRREAQQFDRVFADAGQDSGRAFTRGFERRADPRVDIDARTTSRSAGDAAGTSFAGGFAGAGGLAKLGTRAGPIGAAIVGGAAAGIAAIKPQIEAALNLEASRSLTGARLGFDPARMAKVADGAAAAFAANWGPSVAANLDTAVAAFQAGLLDATSDTRSVQRMIEQLTSVSTILGEDIPEVARSTAQAIRTGIAGTAVDAFDLMVKGQQQGLNVSQDMLDTISEYGTQFRKLGLSGPEAFGLLSQAVKGGARDTDVAADALKEFSIRVVDGSDTTSEAFTALGLDSDEMARRFITGGRSSATAFDEVVDKIRGIQDPVEQSRIAVELFGTQAEDLGGALSRFDLSTAVDEFGRVEGASQQAADTMVKTSLNEWQTAGRNIEAVIARIRDSLNMDEWFSSIPKAINQWFDPPSPPTPGAPGVPALPTLAPTAPAPAPVGTPAARNPLDVFAPNRPGDGIGGPTAADFYGPNAAGVDVGVQQIAAIASRFGLTLTSGARNEPGSYHNLGAAGDFAGPVENMRAFAEFMAQNFGSQMKELIFSGPGWQGNLWNGQQHQYSQGTLGDHTDHVHAALADDTPLRNGGVPVYVTGADTTGPSPSPTSGSVGGGGLGQIGPGLDSDFGLSRGLPGLVDNLIRGAASAAFAPAFGQLSAISAASPIQGGHGLMGVMGAQNIAAGGTPLGFAPPGMPPMPVGGPGGTVIGGVNPLQGTGQGGVGASDSTMAIAGMAAGALDVMAPGAGQAAQTAMKLANRAIQYGGQVAGIATQGVMDTFLPFGGSELAQNNWLTRIVGGIAGAAPALPNVAGQPSQPTPEQVAGSNPNTTQHGQGGSPGQGNTYNANITNNQPRDEGGSGRDAIHVWKNQAPGMS